jgi:hypothetical protein
VAAVAALAILPAPALAVQSLGVTVQGSGHVTSAPTGIDCPQSCKAEFKDFEQVTLTAKPDAGWELKAWSGDCTPSGATCTDASEATRSTSRSRASRSRTTR